MPVGRGRGSCRPRPRRPRKALSRSPEPRSRRSGLLFQPCLRSASAELHKISASTRNDMREVIIHMGYPKTGTSALQLFLRDNRRVLADGGIFFPRGSRTGKTSRLSPHSLANSQPAFLPRYAKGLISNEAFMARPHPHKFIESRMRIDSTAYWAAREKALLALRNKFSVLQSISVLVYIRRPLDFLCSLYNEAVKRVGGGLHFFAGDLADFADRIEPLLDYEQQIELLHRVFGVENVMVRIYDRECLLEGDVRRDFLHALKIPDDGFQFHSRTPNQRLCGPVLEYARKCNSAPMRGRLDWARRRARSLLWSKISQAMERDHGQLPPWYPANLLNTLSDRYETHDHLRELIGHDISCLTGDRRLKVSDSPYDLGTWEGEIRARLKSERSRFSFRVRRWATMARVLLHPTDPVSKHAALDPHSR